MAINPLDKIVDNLSEEIAVILETAKNELGIHLIRVVDDVDTLIQIDDDDLYKTKVANGVEIFKKTHADVLGATTAFAAVDGSTLTTLMEFDMDLFEKSIVNPISAQLKQTVAKGITTGLHESQMIALIKDNTLSKSQISTVVNTQLNNYSRTVTNEMMKTASSNAKYVYIGPSDEKTRPICSNLLTQGEVTHKTIEANWPQTLTEGGGYNCRHKWEISDVG